MIRAAHRSRRPPRAGTPTTTDPTRDPHPIGPLQMTSSPAGDPRLEHISVEVFDEEDVGKATDRLREAGMNHLVQDETTC